MKRILLSALIGIGILTATFQIFSRSSEARMPEDYPLVCRGGGSLVIGIAPGEENIGFSFTRGTKPAGEGLAPGECSWVDRGMYPNEPDRVSQHVEEGSGSLKVGGTLAAENRWYEELHSADSYWTFMVSNNGRGQLIATSARPNKAKDVSPTARVPSVIGQILRRDLPTARTPGVETPKIIVLSNPEDPSSRTEVMKGLPGGLSINVPPAPRALSIEEKVELLESAGLKTLDEKPTPYVTLTPQQPYVAGRGFLVFRFPFEVDTDYNVATWDPYIEEGGAEGGNARAYLNFETKGTYLMTLTVMSYSYRLHGIAPPEFVFVVVAGDGTRQTFLGKLEPKPWAGEWQHLNVIVEVAKAGKYHFRLYLEQKAENLYGWTFRSCDVTAWRK